MASKPKDNSVLKKIMDLHGLSYAELRTLWRTLYSKEPTSTNRLYLIKRLAYRIQELAYGGLSATSKDRVYRYYQCGKASKNGHLTCPVRSVAAGEIEGAVVHQLRSVFQSPEMLAQTFRATKDLEVEELDRLREERSDTESRLADIRRTAARLMDSGAADSETAEQIRQTNDEYVETQRRLQDINNEIEGMQARLVSERDVSECLRKLDPIWEELYPLEQTRIVQLLVEKVTINIDGLNIRIRTNGLHSLVSELKDTVSAHEERNRE